jgi:uncharacterized membrane protein YhaH (DUF805 family)
MSDSPQHAWFYTREGERMGPVTLADLRIKAGEGGLNPRLDMVWTHGMAEWKPAGEIDALFEKRVITEAPEPLAPAIEIQPGSASNAVEEMMSHETGWPGARRRAFYAMTVLFPIVWHLGFTLTAGLIEPLVGQMLMPVVLLAVLLVPLVVAIYFSVQRLANVGMSRWWIFGNLVPFLNLWVGYRSCVCPAGYAYHKKLDPIGVVLAVLYWLLIAFVLLAVVAVVAALMGMIGDPELMEEIRKLIDSLPKMPASS